MKKVIVTGFCTTLVCFFLSSFNANSNSLASTVPGYSTIAPLQDTTMKMKKKMKKKEDKMDTTSMKMKKKPS